MEDYYARKEVSNSDLSELKMLLSSQASSEPAEAYRFGRLLDCLITEPFRVDEVEFKCGSEPFTPQELHEVYQMKEAFMRDELCRRVFLCSRFQRVMVNPSQEFDHTPRFTLPVRCKWDLWIEKQGWGGDIKSTSATTEKQFLEAARYFDYDRQRYFYMNIASSTQDLLIGISKVNYRVFKIPIQRGDMLWRSGREKTQDLAFKYWLMFGS